MAIAYLWEMAANSLNILADEIKGTEGDDNLVGTINADIINGLGGHDKIDSKNGKRSSKWK